MFKALSKKTVVAATVALSAVVVSSAVAFAAITWPINPVNEGSTTVYPIAAAVASGPYAVNFPDAPIVPVGTGSGPGLNLLLNGQSDVANASRAVKSSDDQTPTVSPKVSELDEWVVAKDAIVPVISDNLSGCFNSNPPNITKLELAKIYGVSPQITNWSGVADWSGSCADRPIVPVAREIGSGTRVSFIELVANGLTEAVEAAWIDGPPAHGIRGTGNPNVVAAIQGGSDRIGYVGLGFVPFAGGIQMAVAGVLGSEATVNNSTYTLARKLYMYTVKFSVAAGAVNPVRPDTYARGLELVNQTVGSAGQLIVANEGFVALSANHSIPRWDVNVDGVCNIQDITTIGQKWLASESSHPGWVRQDVNRDSVVNITDITVAGAYWLQTWDKGWTQ